ncbi:MAG: molecular chaperone DnaJ [Rhodospirillaceae bacterium]|nr:molecular chaperone DnaJ [Rhodospirillaceae bacterium]MBT3909716.1 molecular chaperone DnaJ [Rhodospirillaceae bacterium]MBT5300138.1 molecular chaperone DnaJ [Rhodospirillaceae bacterium]MBT5513677.1 molecular chaperone DnaJ [Rhodospirillaceae bacterium]MBT6084652.1 molecular chaperone DnaJ [Rhodospirillaceae bacterium]
MFSYIILGFALLAGVLLAGRWYATADTKTLLKALKWTLLGIVVATALFFVVTGRLGWALATLPALLPWFFRIRAVARAAKTFARMSQANSGAGGGETSVVETRFVHMCLDHDSGDMTGEVVEGTFAGRRVETMRASELVELLQICWSEDEESARLVEAYLDRHHTNWRETAGQGTQDNANAAPSGTMGRAEAFQVLGLDESAGPDDIKDAHRRLISGLHPDHGGSDYLAAKINQAKDILLGE